MTPMIKPTVGRVVHYRPAPSEGIPFIGGQSLAAIIVAVHDDRLVNLTVFDALGESHARTSIRLVQPFDARAIRGGGYAEWMPYQIAKAD